MKTESRSIASLSKEELQKLLDESPSFLSLFATLGLSKYSGHHKNLNRRVEKENLDLTKLNKNRLKKQRAGLCPRPFKLTDEEYFTEGSFRGGSNLKKRLLSGNYLKEVCSDCGIGPEYNNKPLTLQVDHVNGSNEDNRMENLRLLCPNCHSQTDTFCGRSIKLEKKKIREENKEYKKCSCGKRISEHSNACRKCNPIRCPRRFDTTYDELYNLVVKRAIPFVQLGKRFGVSDNAIRKRCVVLGVPFKYKDIKSCSDYKSEIWHRDSDSY